MVQSFILILSVTLKGTCEKTHADLEPCEPVFQTSNDIHLSPKYSQPACPETHLSLPKSHVGSLAWEDIEWGFKHTSFDYFHQSYCWPLLWPLTESQLQWPSGLNDYVAYSSSTGQVEPWTSGVSDHG